VHGKYIYWAEEGLTGYGTSIGRADLDGTHVNQHFITGAQSPYFIAVG
jgi:hypothetical protein